MEAFFRTHTYLVEHTNAPVHRTLMDEIDWNDRMIGIRGSRGIGKTTFLLQYAKEHFDPRDRQCLYVNMNNFYFQGHGICDFAGEFYKRGGRTLLIDQVFKQPNWSKDASTLLRLLSWTEDSFHRFERDAYAGRLPGTQWYR